MVTVYGMVDKMHILVSEEFPVYSTGAYSFSTETQARNSGSYELMSYRRIRPFLAWSYTRHSGEIDLFRNSMLAFSSLVLVAIPCHPQKFIFQVLLKE